MVRQFSAASLAAVVIGLVACESTPATPQVALTSSLSSQSKTSVGFDSCPTYGPFIEVGAFRGPTKEETDVVVDGEDVKGSPLKITCSVIPDGDSFNVDVQAQVTASEGGTVHVIGTFKASGEQTGVRAIFQAGDYGQFTDDDCTVTYYDKSKNEDPSKTTFRGVAAGRVWGFLTCGAAENVQSNKACSATAQFRFENCAKE